MVDESIDIKAASEAAVAKFQLERVLNQDQGGRRTSMLGTVDGRPALLVVERAPFPTSEGYLGRLPGSLARLRNLGANDVYSWHMAQTGAADNDTPSTATGDDFYPDVKINLIYPCTETHVKKYSKQGARLVTETPALYRDKVRPYMEAKRAEGRLNWVYNIIEGRTEVEDVIYRTPLGRAGDEGFLLLPDLNWDRSTLDALHLLALVERRDLWSLRDLRRRHVPWLRHMRDAIVEATVATYPSIEADQLKLYVHYQPTYYHFHIHVVHVALEAGATQATGKAIGLDSIVETLEVMKGKGEEEAGMDGVSLTYTLGEASELWTQVFAPLKTARPASRPPGQGR
ncbi:Scavenger mRNA decapping enzyme [Cordyceps fumosorosea ARSEF 2679]|uniref:Scavenger mRNA decapping enzyme n=1 Tax=Cordyceps fumosorosea (strain ARSEF 2679) TaxID=1081104 RepID=A0A167UAH7_CORFA|nr:Scavenger mRNA decapping enzyme [Cordyceps fumosorosea ARSEF 2679]OAA61384.1 Scavenger mRNA decapping enzyme [Cordyceps fumosorosea ARSEF 2679]